MYQCAERTVRSVVKCLINKVAASSTPSVPYNSQHEVVGSVVQNNVHHDHAHDDYDSDKVDGVACLCDVLEYFIQIIRKRAELFTFSSSTSISSPLKNNAHQSHSNYHHQYSNNNTYSDNKSSGSSSGSSQNNSIQAYLLDEVSNDSDILHLLLSLKEISAMLTSGGNLSTIHKVLVR